RSTDFADLAVPHDRRSRGLAAHADEGQLLEPLLLGLVVGEPVGGVRVAAARGLEDLVTGADGGRLRPPGRAIALQPRDQGPVDVALFEQPDENGGDQAAVLAGIVNTVVGGAHQQDLLGDARDLLDLALTAEQVLLGGGLPVTETGAGPGAGRAALLPVDAVGETVLVVFEVERLVTALFVFVADHVVGTGDHAC